MSPAPVPGPEKPPTVRLREVLWGEGFVSPGDPQYILSAVTKLGLTPARSLLDLGAGLGGPARVITREFGAWITCLEASAELARIGMEEAVMHGLGRKAPIYPFDPANLDLDKDKFDHVFSKEFLYTTAHKDHLVRQIAHTLRPGGQLLMSDYVLPAENERSATVEEWAAVQELPELWDASRYRMELKQAGLDLRVKRDMSAEILQFVRTAWTNYEDVLRVLEKEPGSDEETLRFLAREAKVWAACAKALEAGELQLVNFHAAKPGISTLMSNWD